MRRIRLQAQIISGSIAGGLLAGLALVFAGCPDEAADCHNILTCPAPNCAEAGDVQGCIPDDNGEDGGSDAQED
jgi:hypothetical protein